MHSKLHPETPPTAPRTPIIYRQVALTLEAFDRLKDWQRRLERIERRRFTNSELLDRIIRAADLS
jgi:hypothetical protein